MSQLRTSTALVAVVAVAVAGGQAVSAAGAIPMTAPTALSRPPSLALSRSVSIAAAQSGAIAAARALGLDSRERLVVKDVISDANGSTHVRYDPTFDGLRVIGGDLVSHRDGSGTISGISWNGVNPAALASIRPRIGLASAKAVGGRQAGLVHESGVTVKGELVVFTGRASGRLAPRLAYDVLTRGVRADQTPSRLHTIVDALTGATLESWDEIQSEGTGHGMYVGTVQIGTTPGSVWSMLDAEGNNTTDLNGTADGTGTDSSAQHGTTFTDRDNVWGDGTMANRASAGVDAHYGAEQTLAFYKNILGRNGIWNNGAGVRSRVHYGDGYVNAFWDGNQMTYGDGARNARPVVALDVAGHEMSHGVTGSTAGLVYTGEAGGLNEATSDIFGTAVEWYANNPSDTPDYLIGEKVDIRGNGTPLRYLDRPSRDGSSKDCWSSSLSSLDPHISSGPLNHWFYLASEGSGAKVVNGMSYDSPTCNDSTVTAVGRDRAEKIWYRTLTTYLTSDSDYGAARDGALHSAKDLYPNELYVCLRVAAAFSAIAVRPGEQRCHTTGPTPTPTSTPTTAPAR